MKSLATLRVERTAVLEDLLGQLAQAIGGDPSNPQMCERLQEEAEVLRDDWRQRIAQDRCVEPSSVIERLLAKLYVLDLIIDITVESQLAGSSRIQ